MKARLFLIAALAVGTLAAAAFAEVGPTLVVVKPQYLPPAEVVRMLDARTVGGRDIVEWRTGDAAHSVELRLSDAANGIILAGAAADVAAVQALIAAADMAPHQIAIEARIVEVDESKARDLGIDWSKLSTNVNLTQRASWASQVSSQRSSGDYGSAGNSSKQRTRQGTVDQGSQFSLNYALTLLDQNGAATYRDAPRILTLNNHRATILDGTHVTYVTRYSATTNLFATDSMEAGLRLSVLPSLGESGYLTLDLRAELTSLSGNISGISGSPVKDGQVVENTVMVKDGDSVLLGGFTRTVSEVSHRRFPLLGSVLPFLFSRDIVNHSQRQTFFIVTPHVVDLTGGLDPATKGAVEVH